MLPSATTLLAFTAATIALVAIPGANVLYILGSGIGSGRRAALASAVGVEAGTLVHITAAAFGISAMLSAAPVAFDAVRYAGAAYLIYLAVQAFRQPAGPTGPTAQVDVPVGQALRHGLVVNVLNPKVSLFFLAFLPQFVDPAAPHPTVQVLVLGMVFFVVALGIDLGYALASGSVGAWLASRPRLARRQGTLTGTVYLALAALAVGTGHRPARTAA